MFDEQPDGDPHGECAAEIHRLERRFKLLETFADTHAGHSRGCASWRGQHIPCTCGFDEHSKALKCALAADGEVAK